MLVLGYTQCCAPLAHRGWGSALLSPSSYDPTRGDGPLQGGLPLPAGDNPSPAPLTRSDKTLTQTAAFLSDIFLLVNQEFIFSSNETLL